MNFFESFKSLEASFFTQEKSAKLASSKGEFEFLDEVFYYEFKKVKFLRLKINKNHQLKLSIPLFYKEEKVFQFIKDNEKWIKTRLETIKNLKKEPNKDEISFLGKNYKTKLEPFCKKTHFKDKILFIKNEQDLDLFLRKNAKIIFNFYLKKWQKHFEKKVRRVSVKKMRTRWGSCNHTKAYINLNLNLMQKPLKAIEYVILHELTHLYHPHHQSSFYEHLQALMPDFRQRERNFFKNRALD